jgi:hypothetical protein
VGADAVEAPCDDNAAIDDAESDDGGQAKSLRCSRCHMITSMSLCIDGLIVVVQFLSAAQPKNFVKNLMHT